MLEKKLLEEVKRFNAINKYGKKMIMEQDTPPAPEAGDVPPPPPAGGDAGVPPTDVPPPPPAGGDAGVPPTDLPPAGDAAPLDGGLDSTEEVDSYPFNEKPQEFFAHKQGEMKQSGKNEYILTKDDVQNYPKDGIMKSFNPNEDQKDEYSF
jgi:hypothetical protein